ncbi:UNVERIFIED_CONTAM: hypothetical protein HDU68_002372 [Siphonaria sp. JEL0065]|nr:hypothetical protein HDU68_002372 [Siphonaria sp. JEL0065]
MSNKKVLIIGAGTVGPLLGVALKRAGFAPHLFDAAPTFADIGGGFNLSPNGLRFVKNLGLLDKVYEAGTPVKTVYIHKLDGRPVGSFSGDIIKEKYGIANTGILRSRFNAIAVQAAREESIPISNGKRLTGISQTNDKVTASFEDGSSETGDLLIGADGLRSATRQILFGKEDPEYTGMDAIIGVTHVSDLPAGAEYTPQFMTAFQGKGTQFGIYGIGHGQLVWFIAARGDGNGKESWATDVTGSRQLILERLQSLGAAPISRQVVEHSSRVLRFAICDRKPLATWSQGRCVLIGDAAHPMSPHLGQGANTALEDGGLLSELLKANSDDHKFVFSAFEKARLARTTTIVKSARGMAASIELVNPFLCDLRDKFLALMFAVMKGPPVDGMYRYDYVEVSKKLMK